VKSVAIVMLLTGVAAAQEQPVTVIPPPPDCAQTPCPPGYEPATPTVVAPPPPKKAQLFAKLGASYAYRYAFERHFNGAGLDITLGARNPTFGGGVRIDVHAGRTDTQLDFTWVGFGPAFDIRASSRVHVGFGFSVGWLRMARVTRPERSIDAATMGLWVEPAVDVVKQQDGGGLYLAARLFVDGTLSSTTFSPVSVVVQPGIGYRF
jgi:hypothetical protein